MNAVIIKWDLERGFGFARTLSGKHIFCHIKNWMEAEAPASGQQIQFELGPSTTPNKPDQAINIRLVSDVTAGVEALNALKMQGVRTESVTTGGK